MDHFIIIGDSIIDLDRVLTVQKRHVAGDPVIKVLFMEKELVIEAFETLEERNKEFDRVVNLLNAV